MSALYEELRAAVSDRERQAITSNVINEMRASTTMNEAYMEYYWLSTAVLRSLGYGAAGISSDYAGEFPPVASTALVLTPPRVSGFLQAIRDVPKMDSAIEAGPGASAIFSVAAAMRGAQVRAFEVNQEAAACATEMARLTGYADRIDVTAGDVLAVDLSGQADVAIAEILGPGLRAENGPAVIAALGQHAVHVIPDAAVLYALDVPAVVSSHDGPWQKITDVILTEHITRAEGALMSTGSGERQVKVRADICAQGKKIVAGLNTDDLTSPIAVGGPVVVPRAGLAIEFAYDLGPAPYATPDYVHVTV